MVVWLEASGSQTHTQKLAALNICLIVSNALFRHPDTYQMHSGIRSNATYQMRTHSELHEKSGPMLPSEKSDPRLPSENSGPRLPSEKSGPRLPSEQPAAAMMAAAAMVAAAATCIAAAAAMAAAAQGYPCRIGMIIPMPREAWDDKIHHPKAITKQIG